MALARPGSAQWPQRYRSSLYWVQSLPQQGGRLVLMQQSDSKPGTVKTVTPDGFNIRTRVHEYGGRCHVIVDDAVYFVNFEDQLLYRQSLLEDSRPQPLTQQSDDGWMLADPIVLDDRWLIFVGERKRSGQENENALVALDRQSPTATPIVIAAGDDFYACPVASTDGERLAFFSWNHPDMPWDSSRLFLAEVDRSVPQIRLNNLRHVAGGRDEAICQLLFRRSGELVFAMDSQSQDYHLDGERDFWNLYAAANLSETQITVTSLTSDRAEYGAAHWIFGNRRLVEVGDDKIVAIRTADGGDELVVIDAGGVSKVDSDAVHFGFISVSDDARVFVVAQYHDREACIVEVDPVARSVTEFIQGSSADASDTETPESALSADWISKPVQIEVTTRDGDRTYAWLYSPENPDFVAPQRTLPPLMVLVHGGPTSRAEPSFDLSRQYWTSRGFTVADINHRGSTGFGRSYRQALLGGWGETDVDDIADVVTHLVQTGVVDRDQVVIRGGSAGGYAVLRALTRHPQLFSAGACYYGIGNLATLARSTHKFESRYLDGLLGEAFDESRAEDHDYVYYQRSPINFIADLANPMILFQGQQDRVVPPEVSREVVAVLTEQGLKHEYVEYEGEGHGFRKAQNRIDALTRETAFTLGVLGEVS